MKIRSHLWHLAASAIGVLLLSVFYLLDSRSVVAFIGPSQPPPGGSGAIRVDSFFNLSVGTSTTASTTKLLTVASTTASSSYAFQAVQPGGAPILVVRGDGRVGVATNNPSQTFEVAGNANITGAITASGSATITGNITTAGTVTATAFIGGSISAANVTPGTFNSAYSSSGNYAFPAGLTVDGNVLSVDATLNRVGIGTTTPSYPLHVIGDIGFSGTLQLGSVPWTRLTSFPSACPGGQYVTAVGGTLTCSAPASGPSSGKRRFTANGIFTVPSGVTKIFISGCGGGGGGAGSNGGAVLQSGGGGGGGGGACVIAQEFTVSEGQQYTVTIGEGGTKGTGGIGSGGQATGGGNGGTTSIGSLLSLPGGIGGYPSTGNPNGGLGGAAGGSGGSGGGNGQRGAPSGYGARGGEGGGTIFGAGGPGGNGGPSNISTPGKDGAGYGGGGGGGGGLTTTDSGKDGGVGAPGFLLIEW